MSSYIARLMRQTGVKVANANDASVALPATDLQEITVLSPADVSEREVQGELVPGPDKPVVRPPGHVEPGARRPAPEEHRGDVSAMETPVPGEAAYKPAISLLPDTPFISIAEAEPGRTSEQEEPRPNSSPPPPLPFAGEDSPISEPLSQEIVHGVMTWLADNGGTSSPARIISDASPPAPPTQRAETPRWASPQLGDNSIPPVMDGSPPGESSDPEIGAFAGAHSSAPPLHTDEPWSVHIDTIQLTIEEPAVKRSPPPVAPRAAPPAEPQRSPPRLRRHYLRTF